MSPPIRSIVLRAAGTNCEHETKRALELAGSKAEIAHLLQLQAEPQRLDDVELLVIAGGFSYGDDVAAGRVFGLELRSTLAEPLARFVARGGHVLGVCNGFQVLVETGLLQGGSGANLPPIETRPFALTSNTSNQYECRWVTLRAEKSACTWLTEGELMPTPVAHAEGHFAVRDDAVLQALRSQGQIALTYCRADGSSAAGHYPENPNGSVQDVAGLCDPTGRVLGLMPHPERNLDPWNHPHWTRLGKRTEGEGLSFYQRLVEAAGSRQATAGAMSS
ncbi:MAG: phosphoribosylformylglycinamidine synthase I [Planctomycetota bacterium]